MNPAALYQAAGELLAAARGVLTDPPGRSYVSVGEPPWDCEQLVVWTSGLSPWGAPDQPSGFPQRRGAPFAIGVTYSVSLLRCVPPINARAELPTATVLEGHAADSYAEAFALWAGLQGLVLAGTLLGDSCSDAQVGDLTPLPASGAFDGWTVEVRALLDTGPLA